MSDLSIECASRFLPGRTVDGVARWRFDRAPRRLDLNLLWFTRGKGTRDSQVVDTLAIDAPPAAGQLDFSLPLPDAPYSFSGRLISLIWAVELVAEPSGEHCRVEIAMSPTGAEIDLAGKAMP